MVRSLLPWLTLVAVIWLQSISGTNTDFPAYSSHLKSCLAITQVSLNNLAVASDAGKLLAWCSGIAAARLPLWSVLATGVSLGAAGYGLQCLLLARRLFGVNPSYYQFLLLSIISGNSVCWINTACYVAAMRSFPVDHGAVVGLATSYTGLSAKIYVAVAQVVSGGDGRSNAIYLLLNAAVPAAVGLVAAPFLGQPSSKPAKSGAGVGLFSAFAVACATGGYALVETIVPELGGSRGAALVLLAMVGVVAAVPVMMASRGRRTVESLEVEVSVVVEIEEEGKKEGSGVGEDEHGVWGLVRRVEFWVYFMEYLCGATLGLVYGNNLGQIAQSRGVGESVLLSISSSFGFFGKLSSAPLSALARSKYKVSRPATVALLMVPMTASFFMLLSPAAACLFASTAIIGTCTGAITSIAVSMTADLFGCEHFGVNHNIVVANIPIGSLLFGYIAAFIYDREGGGGHEMCTGAHCYRATFVIWGCICSFGTLLSFVLYLRTRKCLGVTG